MRRLIVVALAGIVLAAVVVPASGATTKTVLVGPDVKFGPSRVTINRGDSVRFQWTGALLHNIRITKGPQRKRRTISGVKAKGVVTRRFTKAGTYRLLCDVHAPEMKMTITVR
jgi:plastocyanin